MGSRASLRCTRSHARTWLARTVGAIVGLLMIVGPASAYTSRPGPAPVAPAVFATMSCSSATSCVATAHGAGGATLDGPALLSPSLADFTWSGATPSGTGASNWSNTTNWIGGVAPSGSVGTLAFPALTTAACTANPPTTTCYQSRNDLSAIDVNSLLIDDGTRYSVTGNGITLGGGGIAAAPGGGTTCCPGFRMPISLTADQTWSITGGSINQQLAIGGAVTGNHALTVAFSAQTFLGLTADVEVGPVTVGGSSLGVVALGTPFQPGSLNATDGNTVSFTAGTGLFANGATTGPLTMAGGQIQVGQGDDGSSPDGTLTVNGSAALDSASRLLFFIDHSGTTPGTDYTQLSASGPVDLANAHLRVADGFTGSGPSTVCAQLTPGDVDTLIATTGSLTGTFVGIPDGTTISLSCFFGGGGGTPPTVKINYTAHTVTATVETPGSGGGGLSSSTSATIHDAAHVGVSTVEAGSTVHDFVTVTGQPSSPVPTGNISIDWFTNDSCTGSPAASSGSVGPLDAGGHFDATSFAQGPLAAGVYAFQAHYPGNATYSASNGPCEPLGVVDANIQITPPTATNPTRTMHVLTGHVNVNAGSGFVNAPDGTQISFTIDSGPGSFTTANPCTTSGGTGSCTITLTSSTPGTTVVSAHATVAAGSLSLHRDTSGTGGDSGPATKGWAAATVRTDILDTNNAVITSAVPGASVHDTVSVDRASGTPASVPSPSGNVIFHRYSGTTCTGTPTDQTVTLTPTAQSSSFTATSSLSYQAEYLGDANYPAALGACEPLSVVDANIQISPNGVIRTGQTHTFTAHVNVNTGTGFVNAPDGTQVSFTIDSGAGAFTSANPCTTSGGTGSCTIGVSSALTGVTTVGAHTTVSVGGVSLTRDTNGSGGNSGPATLRSVNAKIAIDGSGSTEVGHPQTFTVTLQKDIGDGTGFVAAAGEAVTVTLAASNGARPTPAGPLTGTTDAAGQFRVTSTSVTAGTVRAHASSTLAIGGATTSVETDASSPNSGDAVVTIAPLTPPTPAPVPQKTEVVKVTKGKVLIQRTPGGPFVPLTGTEKVPFGVVIDTTNGTLRLTVAKDRKGHTSTLEVNGGKFIATQDATLLTTLTLTGGDFSVCGKRHLAKKSPPKSGGTSVRHLWGNGKGRFRTKGRYSSATVRGTHWLTDDRCAGTLTFVAKGTVTVVDFPLHKTVIVKTGQSYLAKP